MNVVAELTDRLIGQEVLQWILQNNALCAKRRGDPSLAAAVLDIKCQGATVLFRCGNSSSSAIRFVFLHHPQLAVTSYQYSRSTALHAKKSQDMHEVEVALWAI